MLIIQVGLHCIILLNMQADSLTWLIYQLIYQQAPENWVLRCFFYFIVLDFAALIENESFLSAWIVFTWTLYYENPSPLSRSIFRIKLYICLVLVWDFCPFWSSYSFRLCWQFGEMLMHIPSLSLSISLLSSFLCVGMFGGKRCNYWR